jgi:hypothetical protein
MSGLGLRHWFQAATSSGLGQCGHAAAWQLGACCVTSSSTAGTSSTSSPRKELPGRLRRSGRPRRGCSLSACCIMAAACSVFMAPCCCGGGALRRTSCLRTAWRCVRYCCWPTGSSTATGGWVAGLQLTCSVVLGPWTRGSPGSGNKTWNEEATVISSDTRMGAAFACGRLHTTLAVCWMGAAPHALFLRPIARVSHAERVFPPALNSAQLPFMPLLLPQPAQPAAQHSLRAAGQS